MISATDKIKKGGIIKVRVLIPKMPPEPFVESLVYLYIENVKLALNIFEYIRINSWSLYCLFDGHKIPHIFHSIRDTDGLTIATVEEGELNNLETNCFCNIGGYSFRGRLPNDLIGRYY